MSRRFLVPALLWVCPLALVGLLWSPAAVRAQSPSDPPASFSFDETFKKTKPTDDDIAAAVLKAIGAIALHEASKPQPDDGVAEAIARGLSKVARDKLIDSALEDLFPAAPKIERDAVRSLAVLALDGELDRDRDRIVGRLRRTNPDMADAVEAAEFLIQFSKAVDKK
jgi:hypothetical protein